MSTATREIIIDEGQLPAVIDSIALTTADADAILRETALPVVQDEQQRHFATRSSPNGEPWEPWHWRALGADPNHETLEVSGALRGSLLEGGEGNVLEIADGELTFGTAVEYAAINNYGGETILEQDLIDREGRRIMKAGRRMEIPQREFIGMSVESVDLLTQELTDSVIERLKGPTNV